jgi:hypothetical protein
MFFSTLMGEVILLKNLNFTFQNKGTTIYSVLKAPFPNFNVRRLKSLVLRIAAKCKIWTTQNKGFVFSFELKAKAI